MDNHHGSNSDILDMFDLGLGNEMDFETAYKMLSSLDETLIPSSHHTTNNIHPHTIENASTLYDTLDENHKNYNNNYPHKFHIPEQPNDRHMKNDYNEMGITFDPIDKYNQHITHLSNATSNNNTMSPAPIIHDHLPQLDHHHHHHQHQQLQQQQQQQQQQHHNVEVDNNTIEDPLHNLGLLSAFESNAIEDFLDNLVKNTQLGTENDLTSKPIVQTHQQPSSHHMDFQSSLNKHFHSNAPNHLDIENSITNVDHGKKTLTSPPKLKDSSEELGEVMKGKEQETMIGYPSKPSQYNPEPLILPEIMIPDDKIPTSIKDDARSVKKWRHVEIEKVRRTITKNAYDELIGMINKKSKTKSTKRIPKHTLLGIIVNDIKAIVSANDKLEKLIRHREARNSKNPS
ncbi:Ino2p NDAI_0J01230 [Naumovozyma dairenensis CBS 421]|uniref:INO2 bHLH domain-containing protein n=1 Tax=Naumovozyma dairenensis (strain ATCC 10597 / BCRC 20456 / CBS 421 / NBRC 0211 / NRRL Y-12639) TaxID=1071378 RepID=G0WGT7_NAUDC|nr:hypothetical protein NDAI_0J01230 [Naumovozyma dairenensis CBS 421]CCD27015.1 hypothetical protein NDAI_0J01230 [Naumovozyma dairenensis CBS 421]